MSTPKFAGPVRSVPRTAPERTVRSLPLWSLVDGAWAARQHEVFEDLFLKDPQGQTDEILASPWWQGHLATTAQVGDQPGDLATSYIVPGALNVQSTSGPKLDGSREVRIFAADAGLRARSVTLLQIQRGDTGQVISLGSSDLELVPSSGLVLVVSPAALVALGGGLSLSRGDILTGLLVGLEDPSIFWSDVGIFPQDGAWSPLKGGSARLLGTVIPGQAFSLPTGFDTKVGNYLWGASNAPQAFATLRVGQKGDSALPLGLPNYGVLAVEEGTPWDWNTAPAGTVGIVRVSSEPGKGTLELDPDVAETLRGQEIWYWPDLGEASGEGLVGTVGSEDLYLAPVPRTEELPLLRLAGRRPLEVLTVASESALSNLSLKEGQAGLALSTGKVRLPAAAESEVLFYQGLWKGSASSSAWQLVTEQNSPAPLAPGVTLHVPVEAILRVPDGSGLPPALPEVGLARTVGPKIGARTIIFHDSSRVLEVVETNTTPVSLPPQGTCLVDLETRLVIFSAADQSALQGKTLFIRAGVAELGFRARDARLVSSWAEPYVLLGTEEIEIILNGQSYTWAAAGQKGTYLARDLAGLISTGIPTVVANRGKIEFRTSQTQAGFFVGSLRVGSKASLGFARGWEVSYSPGDFAPTFSLGLGLSLVLAPAAEGSVTWSRRADEKILTQVPASPLALLPELPLRDLPSARKGEESFYVLPSGAFLQEGQNVDTLWNQPSVPQVRWARPEDQTLLIQQPTVQVSLPLGVVSTSLRLRISESGQPLETTEQFVLVDEGTQLALTESSFQTILAGLEGGLVTEGKKFSHPSLPGAVQIGDLLLLQETLWTITQLGPGSSVEFEPGAGGAEDGVWSAEVLRTRLGEDGEALPLWADVVYVPFSPLGGEDPFIARVLTLLGVGASNSPRLRLPRNGGQRLRMGLSFSSPRRELLPLVRTVVGRVAPTASLVLPESSLGHLSVSAYEIRFGSSKTLRFQDGNLIQLPTGPLPVPLPSGSAVVLLDTREVSLAPDLVSQYAELEVVFAETFLPSGPSAGYVEINPDTGELSFRGSDLIQFGGTPVYGENTLSSSDWSLSPLLGSFSLVEPLLSGQIVEAQYLRADSSGALLRDSEGDAIEVVEFLPNVISQEQATFLAPKKWAFNPSGKTFLPDLSSQVYLDGNLCNIGTSPVCTVKPNSTIEFRNTASSPAALVRVSYQVLEASGGETNFTVSSGPVWRPGLVLPAGGSSFIIHGNQAASFPSGSIIRVASSLFYAAGAIYDSATDETTVSLDQTVVYEAGSRDLSAPTLSLVSSKAIKDLAGFWRSRELTTEAPRGATSIKVPTGPWTGGFLVEIGSSPYLITEVSTEGEEDTLTLGSPLIAQAAEGDPLRISARPIYAEGQEVLLGLEGPPVGDSLIFIRQDEAGPASRDRGARVSQESITLGTSGLTRTSQVLVYATWQREIPSGTILELSYRVSGVPSFAGAALYGKFYYESPDSWFFQVRPEDALVETVRGDVEGTGTLALAPTVDNSLVGERSLRNELVFVEQKDRIARQELHASNFKVTRFEGLLESMRGYLVGAGSGRWTTSYIRSYSDPAAPGYEEVFGEAWRVPLDMSFVVRVALGTSEESASPILEEEISRQATRLATDALDDLVAGDPLSLPGKNSRAFPLEVGAFFETSPGPYGPNLRQVLPTLFGIPRILTGTTFGKPIAQLGNPVVGPLGGVTSAQVRDRRPVAFVVAYSGVGFPQYDQEILGAGGVPFGLVPRPAVLLSLVPPRELLLQEGGLPQPSQFSTLPNLDTGREDLQNPPFRKVSGGILPRPYVGFPEETGIVPLCQSGVVQSLPIGTGIVPAPVYVGDILLGFIVTFLDSAGNVLTTPPVGDGGELRVFTAEELLAPGAVFYEVQEPPSLPISNPPTEEEKTLLLSALPSYRIGQDVGLSPTDGKLLDATLPSFFAASPLGLMQLVSQRPPQPLSKLEANVELASPPGGTEPLTTLPALTGKERNDDGDLWPYSPPRGETQLWSELQALAYVPLAISPEPGPLYPEEIRSASAEVLLGPLPFRPSATFLTDTGLSPLRSFDLALVQSPQPTAPQGTTGLLQVADVDGNSFRLPRFVSPTSLGARIRYRFDAAVACVNQPPTDAPAGLRVTMVGPITTFSIDPAAYATLNDGSALPQGGLNAIFNPTLGPWPWPNNANIVRINLFTPSDGNPVTYIQTVILDVGSGVPTATGDAGVQGIIALPQAFLHSLEVQTAVPFVSMSFVPGPGQLPEDPLNPGTSLPLQFTIDVDTSGGGNPLAPAGSWTGSIHGNRLTFQEGFDLRTVRPASEPAVDGQLVHGRLNVVFVEGPLGDTLTCNSSAEINGGLGPLTFAPPTPPEVFVGTFSGGVGTVDVPSVQGFGNSGISITGGKLAVLPSSSWDTTSPILQGVGEMEAGVGFELFENRVLGILPSVGSLGQVQAGDLLAVTGSSDPLKSASSKVGTYVVYQAVVPEVGQPYKEFVAQSPTLPLGSETLLRTIFPSIVSISLENVGMETLVVSEVELEGVVAFPQPAGNLYLVRETANLTQTLVLPYTGLDVGSRTFSIDPTGLLDSGGAPISPSVLSSLPAGTLIAGATKVFVDYPVARLRQSTVGHLGDGNTSFGAGGSALGLRTLEVSSPPLGGGSFLFPYEQAPAPPDTVVVGPAAAGQIASSQRTVTPAGQFQTDPFEANYETVAWFFDLEKVSPLVWNTIHSGLVPALATLLPGDVLTPTMRVQGGLYLEPSVPRSCLNLGDNIPKIVDAGHSLPASYVGVRSGIALGNPTGPEPVSFEVRRTRRFSELARAKDLQDLLGDLHALLEERTATIVSYGPVPEWPHGVLVTSGTDWTKRGVRPGDEIEVLGTQGQVARIAKIADANTLWILAPGLPSAIPGVQVLVRIHAMLLPQVQACNDLLGVLVDTVLERTADLSLGEGGYVPLVEPGVNDLKDTDGTLDFLAAGVLPGDYLVIDPAGPLTGPGGQLPQTGQEYGARPLGDTSIPARLDAHVPGAPSELDDNRGFYQITGVTSSTIRTSEVSVVSGPRDAPVTISGDYALLPTVTGSTSAWAVAGVEAQQVLRPTAFAGTEGSPPNSFLGNLYSTAPFSYKVARPKENVSTELVEWVLFLRERALSLLDKTEELQRFEALGSWQTFQALEQISNPLRLGVWSNEDLREILGVWETAPFTNWKDALSALDRRVAALDLRLDVETPPAQLTPYADFTAGDQRPTVSDQIEALLGAGLQSARTSWIRYRASLVNGLLAQIRFLETRIQATDQSKKDALTLV